MIKRGFICSSDCVRGQGETWVWFPSILTPRLFISLNLMLRIQRLIDLCLETFFLTFPWVKEEKKRFILFHFVCPASCWPQLLPAVWVHLLESMLDDWKQKISPSSLLLRRHSGSSEAHGRFQLQHLPTGPLNRHTLPRCQGRHTGRGHQQTQPKTTQGRRMCVCVCMCVLWVREVKSTFFFIITTNSIPETSLVIKCMFS